MKSFDDGLIADMVCESNEDLNNSLYEEYLPNIKYLVNKYAIAAHKLGLDYNDLMQEANIGFTEAITTYDESKGANLKTFIIVCVERKIQSALRKEKTIKNQMMQESISLDYDYEKEGLPLKDILGDSTNDPYEQYTEKENIEQIKTKIMNGLSHFEQQVFSYMLNGLDYKEIAQALDKSPKQIDNTMQRVRLKARAIMKE